MNFNLRGWILLKVMGVVYMAAGAVAIFIGFMMPLLNMTFLSLLNEDSAARDHLDLVMLIILIFGAVSLASGIVGFIFGNERKKIFLCLICAVALCLLSAFMIALLAKNGLSDGLRTAALVLAPILYLAGAILNVTTKKSYF